MPRKPWAPALRNTSRSTMPARSHASWCGTSSLAMKPRTESRNSSWSSSNSVRSMAATVTRWLPAPAGARLCAVTVTIEPLRWASDLAPDRPGGRDAHLQRGLGEWVPGERPVSDGGLRRLGSLHRPPRADDRDASRATTTGRGRRPRPCLLARRTGRRACVRVFVDPTARRRGRRSGASGAPSVEEARADGRTSVTLEVAVGSTPRRRWPRRPGSGRTWSSS